MPTYEKDDYIIPIESIVNMEYKTLLDIIDSVLSENCLCTITDYPSIAHVNIDGQIIDIVIGIGSIVCNKDCNAKKILEKERKLYFRISSTTWVYGRYCKIRECLTTSETMSFFKGELRSLAQNIIWDIREFNKIFEIISKEKKNAFLLILPEYDPLSFVKLSKCGKLRARNPLYPGAALGKLGVELCINNYVGIVGPLNRRISPILDIGSDPLISLYTGIGDAILLHHSSRLEQLHPIILKSLILALLYTCSKGD